ncbi:O-methyltransferase [Gorillibacterium massiliense]|uniref:O-methyltransferase n=1 Tax=Gorillibacterium massiliense TaxID=1280390 RepID=UPI0004B9600A|nr:O-methyltransferase [Gorillibacterium massiliense]
MIEELPLAKQLELVFREIRGELHSMASGCVFVQIRNNTIGKFGVKHNPLESRDGRLESEQGGLTDAQQKTLRQMALDSLRYKSHWTHGEIYYEFAVRKNMLCVSIQFESSYNMANVVSHYEPKKAYGLA